MNINNPINNRESQFENSLNALRKVSLTPEEKGKMFKTLLSYAENHAPVKESLFASVVRTLKGALPIRIK